MGKRCVSKRDHLEKAADRGRKRKSSVRKRHGEIAHEKWIRSGEDLGGDHFIFREYLTRSGELIGYDRGRRPPKGAVFVGLLEYHKRPDNGEWCNGWIAFVNVNEGRAYEPFTGGNRGKHTLVSEHPLTVTASLDCRACSMHGFITEGKWVDA